VAGFLLILMAAGSLWLWIGMPALSLWAVSKITDSPARHLTLGLLTVPLGMVLFAPLLFWINGLYLRVTGTPPIVEEADGSLRRIRGPLEMLLVWSLVIALVAFCVWFVTGAPSPAIGWR
jgi:hypothetical protein